MKSILDADYYTEQRRSLEDLDTDLGMFHDLVDLAPFREVLTSAEARQEFFSDIDLGARWEEWLPHLRALDELMQADVVEDHVVELMGELLRHA